MYQVAVILINYNSSKYSLNCIKSILDKTDTLLNFQIIVIDNASETDDFLQLENGIEKLAMQNLILKRSKINTGFGGGNMFGVQFADAKYYAFVNNDTLFTNDCLTILYNAMEQNSEYGICGPQCFNEEGKHLSTLDYFASPAREILGRKFLNFWNKNEYPSKKIIYTKPQKGQFVAGSFMMLRAKDFHDVGGFDTNIFLYYEETDLCKRLRKIGKYAYEIPDAKFVHYHGVSTPRSIAIKKELKLSLLYVVRKHYGFFWYRILLVFLVIRYFFSSLAKPKYWTLFGILFRGAHLSESMKHQQKLIK